ncbi:MAG: glycoside hydrolase family 9 protein, partial [Myxococcaceae bacterium]
MIRRLCIAALLLTFGCVGKTSDLVTDSGTTTEQNPAADAGEVLPDGGSFTPVTIDTGIEAGLHTPNVGEHELRVVSQKVLELVLITSKSPDPARVDAWDFVDETTGQLKSSAPQPSDVTVLADGQSVSVQSVGFRRRVRYAPLVMRDLRIENSLYLVLSSPIADGAQLEVKNPSGALWASTTQFVAKADPLRLSTAIHVNQVGYATASTKRAQVGYYLGSLGELDAPTGAFSIIDARTGAEVFTGTLSPRLESGFNISPTPYQHVVEADFSAFQTPGDYRLKVPGMGASYPFSIDDGVPGAFARTYALGMLHQRCGAEKKLPFTRFVSRADHVAPAQVPTASSPTWQLIAGENGDYAANQAAGVPQLKDLGSMLYPFVRQGLIDVHGGHHDAGDYSKYTNNSAALVHTLVFAADNFPGVLALDNLGLPESGDGKSDILQLAKWEADFLTRMQDDDGGFYFLVYPRVRAYEGNVVPEDGDGQLVWPKTTSVSAAATAALAQIASSPGFKAQFPTEAAAYLDKAKKGWGFLTAAIAKYGKDGAYQKITHYGNTFRHDDELVWAATELYLATGDSQYHDKIVEWLPDPSSDSIKQWGWWRLFDAYGNAIRDYAFGAKSGRVAESALEATRLAKCQSEVKAAGNDQLTRATASSYGTSFPLESKAFRVAGWYFSSDQAFDIAVAYQLDARQELMDALISNLNYESGSNPVNVSYVTGLGWKQPREIVHQWAQSDWRVLPPSGIPQGNVQQGFMYLGPYGSELGALTFPSDGVNDAPYPMYDRWGDSFNVTTEFVVPQLARAMVSSAMWMAKTSAKDQAWSGAQATIVGVPTEVPVGSEVTATLQSALPLGRARIFWDGQG